MLYDVYDGAAEWVGSFEADDDTDAVWQFRNWLSENADEDAGPLDYSYKLYNDDSLYDDDSEE